MHRLLKKLRELIRRYRVYVKDFFADELHKREEDYDDEDIWWDNITERVELSELEAAIEEI